MIKQTTIERGLLNALAVTALLACRTPATQIELFIDSDAPANRSIQLRVRSFSGAVPPAELLARAQPLGPLGETVLVRDTDGTGNLALGGSIGILPVGPGDAAAVTVWIRASIGASATSPEIRLDRVARVSFVRGQRGTARVFLAVRCGDTALGCTSVSANECTVSVRCREQNATCGDQGECVAPVVSTLFASEDGAVHDSASAVGLDVLSGRVQDASVGLADSVSVDGGPLGDSGDASLSDSNIVSDVPEPTDPTVSPPQLLFPQSMSRITSRNPDFLWTIAALTDAVDVMVCRDRGCTSVVDSFTSSLGHETRDTLLPASSVLFWRARGRRAGVAGRDWSPTWEFITSATGARRSTFAGIFADYNGDGLSDIVVGAPGPGANAMALVYYGRRGGLPTDPGHTLRSAAVGYGSQVACAGDVNGDGFSDLLVGAPREFDGMNAAVGAAYLYLGSPLGVRAPAFQEFRGVNVMGLLGSAVAGLGDVNGDGLGDIAIGAPLETAGGMAQAGNVYVYTGVRSGQLGPPTILAAVAQNDEFGRSLAPAGDVNADGFADLIVGGDYGGRVAIFHGGAGGISRARNLELRPVSNNDRFGFSVAGLGDVNGDGFADVGVGAIGEDFGGRADTGSAHIYLGAVGGVAATEAFALRGVGVGDQFGSSLNSAGDLNRDGLDDVIVGAYFASVMGAMRQGTATVYHSEMIGAATSFALHRTLTGPEAGALFGASVVSSPDCNGDGFVDLVVGAYQANSAVNRSGNATVYYSDPLARGVPMAPSVTLVGSFQDGLFGFSVALNSTSLRRSAAWVCPLGV